MKEKIDKIIDKIEYMKCINDFFKSKSTKENEKLEKIKNIL